MLPTLGFQSFVPQNIFDIDSVVMEIYFFQ